MASTVKVLLAGLCLWVVACGATAQSVGGSVASGGEIAVRMFDAGGDGMWLTRLEFRMIEYPAVFHARVYVLDQDMRVIHILEATLPPNPGEGWVQVPIPSLQVPRRYGIGLTPCANPEEITEANPANSFMWIPGSPKRAFREGNWAIRTSVSGKPVPTPVAPDLVVLTGGDSFFGKLEKITPEPPTLHFTGRAPILAVSVAAVYPDAIKIVAPGPMQAVLRLRDGHTYRGELVSADDTTIVLKTSGKNRPFKRADILQLDFQQALGDGNTGGWLQRGGSSGGYGGSSGGNY